MYLYCFEPLELCLLKLVSQNNVSLSVAALNGYARQPKKNFNKSSVES